MCAGMHNFASHKVDVDSFQPRAASALSLLALAGLLILTWRSLPVRVMYLRPPLWPVLKMVPLEDEEEEL